MGKTISVSVTDSGDGKKEALEKLIEKGSVVSFPRGNINESIWRVDSDVSQTYFHEGTQAGVKRAELITVYKD